MRKGGNIVPALFLFGITCAVPLDAPVKIPAIYSTACFRHLSYVSAEDRVSREGFAPGRYGSRATLEGSKQQAPPASSQ
jgi:hypothetical protein